MYLNNTLIAVFQPFTLLFGHIYMKKIINKNEIASLINQGFRSSSIYRHLGISKSHFYRIKTELQDSGKLTTESVVKFK